MPAVDGSWSCTIHTNTGVGLRVRNAPSCAGAVIAIIDDGVTVQASKEDNGWYFIDQYGGWCSGNFLQTTGGPNAVTSVEIDPETQKEEKKKKKKKKENKNKVIEDTIREYALSTDDNMSTKNLLSKSLHGIHGLPYQFMDSVDRRLPGTKIGEVYADKIVSRMPLLLMTPGRVNFLRDYKNKQSAASVIMKLIDNVAPVDLDQMVGNVGRYYTFDFDYMNYYGCVTQMITSGAVFLELDKVKVNVTGKWEMLGSIDWSEAGNDSFKGILSEKEYVAFYIDSVNQVSENFNNNTGPSRLSDTVNSFSDTAREIQFLLGNIGISPLKDENALAEAMSSVKDIADKYLGGNQLLSDIGRQFGTVALGGKLLFPEIWQDSTFTKNYNISMKLRTPDGDKLSWFMNIYVPLCHLVCMAAPVQAEDGVSGYVSPFLVRAYYRGLFNCEMGIITDMSITKGKEGAWTIDGLPTEIDVDITLKDLYSALTITKNNNTSAFCNNLCLVDYIANTCGININEPDFVRQINLFVMLKYNKYKNFIPGIWHKTVEDVSRRLADSDQKMAGFLSWFDVW